MRIVAVSLALVACLANANAKAQLTIQAGDITDLDWSMNDSPVSIMGAATVPAGATLNIAPGVAVEFDTSTSISVAGQLLAEATEASPITFGRMEGAGTWNGLNFVSASAVNSEITHATFDGAFGAVTVNTVARVTIEHATFTSNIVDIFATAGSVRADSCVFRDNGFASVSVAAAADIVLTNSIFREQSGTAVSIAADAASVESRVDNCTFANTQDFAGSDRAFQYIVAEQGTTTIHLRNSIMTGFQEAAFQDPSEGVTGSFIVIENSNLWNNGTQTNAGVVLLATNVSQDPLYESTENLRLRAGSPSVDSGVAIAGLGKDHEGNLRPGGLGWDMGAFERPSVCGNSVTEIGENCDDGNNNGAYGFCSGDCSGPGERCGDNTVQPDREGCDDGNSIDNDGCTNACTLPTCGDAITQSGEECDDGNAADTDSCLNTCVSATCGDDIVWLGTETCDDGGNNGMYGFCNASCDDLDIRCGDGVLQTDEGEECDDGNTMDDDVCTAACTTPRCGDSIVQASESCDDGNQSDEDACLQSCEANVCNDGFLNVGVEACDDGNLVNDDRCTTDCALPGCGNGVQETGEQCDDGNVDNTDACTSRCLAAQCGDGFVQAETEECDDGNTNADDTCSNTCERNVLSDLDSAGGGCAVEPATDNPRPLGLLFVLGFVWLWRRRPRTA